MRTNIGNKPIKVRVVLNSEELEEFLSSDALYVIGYSYEWENENVLHFHTVKQRHSFGHESHVLFIKKGTDSAQLANIHQPEWTVEVEAGNQVKVKGHSHNDCFEIIYIPTHNDLYSRNKGILEVDVLKSKKVMIIGLGSFGSQIAIELAKAGVGSFMLFDFDRVELHNLARHTCVLNDLGRLKTDAIEDAILGKNPYATVEKYPVDINNDERLLLDKVGESDLVICATDNNQSRFSISEALVKQQKVGIFGRAITRAEGGDVFRYHPGGPCYCCLIGNQWYGAQDEEITDEASARRSGRIPQYMSAEDADAVVQVGLSSDIQPICNMMVKLALVELSKGKSSGISSLEGEFVYDYYMWANRRERHYANWAAMPGAGNKPTIMRWYGAHIAKNPNCPICSKEIEELDTGKEYEKMLKPVEGLENVDLDKIQ